MFTISNVNQIVNGLKDMAGALLAPHDVTLYKGDTISVRLHVNTRSASSTDLTGGIIQEQQLIATIDASDWDAKAPAGRWPQKGDVIAWTDKTYVIDRAHLAAPAGVKAVYKARLAG